MVPFTISRAPYDSVEVAQVSPLVPGVVWSPDGPIFIQNEPEREFPVKMPSDTKIEYDLDGDGVVALFNDRIFLKKGGELFSHSVVVGLGRRCSWLCRIPFYGTPVAGLSKSQSSRACGGCSRESGFCLP